MNPHAGGTRSGYSACLLGALGSVLWPGVGHLVVKARLRPAVIVGVVLNTMATASAVVIVAHVRSRADLAGIIADRTVFAVFGIDIAVLAITRLHTAIDAAWAARPALSGQRVAAGVSALLVVTAGVAPLVIAADYVWVTDRTIEKVFAGHEAVTAEPTPLTTVAGSTASSSTTSTTLPPNTPFEGFGRVNVLLLGGDAGPGRWSLRTDTMVVVSIDPATGDTAMISVPRNLPRLPFPPDSPLGKRFPKGFTDLANAVYPFVNGHRDLAGGGEDAGSQAIKSGIAQLLGIPIHYYVLVDMAGFVDVVDALGGIDIYVGQRVPSPGNPRNAKHQVPAYIERGNQHMDGTLALTYARSRKGDDDYHRMARQRCVLNAIASTATPMTVALGLPQLLGAFGDSVSTDIPRSRLGDFATVIERFQQHGGNAAVRTLHLAPPFYQSSRWKAQQVRDLVTAVLTPPAAAAPGDTTTAGSATTSLEAECGAPQG
jgi:LCP family protein required for cell wall assembly